jgi:hypothetical protein
VSFNNRIAIYCKFLSVGGLESRRRDDHRFDWILKIRLYYAHWILMYHFVTYWPTPVNAIRNILFRNKISDVRITKYSDAFA